MVDKLNYFNDEFPCHIYLIGRKPRVIIDKGTFIINEDSIQLKFKIQHEDSWAELPLKITNPFKPTDSITLETVYPYNKFKIIVNGEVYLSAKPAVFLQTLPIKDREFLDFEVLYVGQSYGVEGSRTAPDRLVNHSTLQGIYSEAIMNNPDSEIWLALASFIQINVTMFDGRSSFTDEEISKDEERYGKVFDKLNFYGINEQQKINFTEAALIKYFAPPYNKIYKESFPSPAHSTYSECYELDVNSVCIEMNTFDSMNIQFYSETVDRTPCHMHNFLLHSKNERESMFAII
ncbi:MAG: hypothetical protein ACI85I_002114 [Arenicella sp.]|jgi:hypothetical protein